MLPGFCSSSRRPFFSIDMDALDKAKVIVASCSSAAVLEGLVAKSGGFDFVVMDEAAQVTHLFFLFAV